MSKITINELSKSFKDYLNDLSLTEAQVQQLIDKFEDEKIGDITQLSTEEKESLVGAINELENAGFVTEDDVYNMDALHASTLEPSNIITTGVDLNNIKENCCCIIWTSANCLNLPPGESGGGGMFKCTITYKSNAVCHCLQEYWRTNEVTPRHFFRTYNNDNAVWSPWQLEGGCSIVYNPDLNTLMCNGNFYVTGPINGPVGDSTGNWYIETMFRDKLYGYQRATRNFDGDNSLPKYERTYYNGTWTAWRSL